MYSRQARWCEGERPRNVSPTWGHLTSAACIFWDSVTGRRRQALQSHLNPGPHLQPGIARGVGGGLDPQAEANDRLNLIQKTNGTNRFVSRMYSRYASPNLARHSASSTEAVRNSAPLATTARARAGTDGSLRAAPQPKASSEA